MHRPLPTHHDTQTFEQPQTLCWQGGSSSCPQISRCHIYSAPASQMHLLRGIAGAPRQGCYSVCTEFFWPAAKGIPNGRERLPVQCMRSNFLCSQSRRHGRRSQPSGASVQLRQVTIVIWALLATHKNWHLCGAAAKHVDFRIARAVI